MKLKQKTRKVFVTSDGTEYVDRLKASDHERKYLLKQWANEVGLCQGGEWSEDMIQDQILKDREKLLDILS